jgi:hypothetical protein
MDLGLCIDYLHLEKVSLTSTVRIMTLPFVLFFAFFAGSDLWSLSDLTVDVLVGFNGRFKTGHWTPVHVVASNLRQQIEGTLELEIEHGDEYRGDLNRFTYARPLLLPKNSSKRFSFVIPLHSPFHLLRLKVTHRGEPVYERDIELRGGEFPEKLVLGLSRDVSLDFLSLLAGPVMGQSDPERIRVIYPHVEFLPESWAGYDAVEAVVFHNVTARSLSERQLRALELWVASGGTLIVSGGSHLASAGAGSLGALLPVEVVGRKIIQSYSALEDRFGQEVTNREPLIVSHGKPLGGEVILEQDGIPLLVEEKRGRGRIVFLAFDFADYPLQTWAGKYALWRSLLPQRREQSPGPDTTFVEIGTEEPEQSLLDAALSVPLPQMPSHLILVVILAVYIFLLWFFLRGKSRIRRSIRIFSMVLAAVLAAGISYTLLNRWLLREDILFADIDLIESSPGWNFGTLRKEIGFLSTRSKQVSLILSSADEKTDGNDVLLEPEGADGFTVIHGGEAKIESISLPSWELRQLKVQALVPFPSDGGAVRDGGLLRIRTKNTSFSTLRSALLLYRGIPYYIGDIPPEQEIAEDFRIYQSVEALKEELPLESYFPEPDRESQIRMAVLKGLLEKPEWDYSLREDTVLLAAWIDESPLKVETESRFVHRYSGTLAILVFQAGDDTIRWGT